MQSVVECVTGVERFVLVFFFKQKTAYEVRISDWSSDVCSSDLNGCGGINAGLGQASRLQEIPHRERRTGGDQAQPCERPEQDARQRIELGRASCRERVCQYV